MKKEYGEKGKRVFYASKNKGTIKGVENMMPDKKAMKKKGTSAIHRSMKHIYG